jgi:hypothetical protein
VFGENLTSRADNFQNLSSGGFVFGQNLTERAENFTPEPKDEKEEVCSFKKITLSLHQYSS